jgi:phosphatidate phosphatase PAH1
MSTLARIVRRTFATALTSVAGITLMTVASGCATRTDSDASEQNLTRCAPPMQSCSDLSVPVATQAQGFQHLSSSSKSIQAANHRGRDLLLNPNDDAYAIAKFAYGKVDMSLEDEAVQIFLSRECEDAWEDLGTVQTSDSRSSSPLAYVPDGGGRAFLKIGKLPPGRHRVRFVVLGDGTTADQIIEVLPVGAKIVVSDVDGTLTTSEHVELGSLLIGGTPDAHPHAAETLHAFANRGYRPFYLTARSEWQANRTHVFLDTRGFPTGVVHTNQGYLPLRGSAAVDFKRGELDELRSHGFSIFYAIGNRDTDGEAFLNSAKVSHDQCKLFQLQSAESVGCTQFDDYADLLQEAESLPQCSR